MRLRKINDEVYYADQPIVRLGTADMKRLKETAMCNARGRARICAHMTPQDNLHEMLIVLTKACYIRPHRHPGKVESFHVIEGRGEIVILGDDGEIQETIPLGDPSGSRFFFYRLNSPFFHTVLVHSETLVFHETTNGPYNPADTIFAPWGPEEQDVKGAAQWMARLTALVDKCRQTPN